MSGSTSAEKLGAGEGQLEGSTLGQLAGLLPQPGPVAASATAAASSAPRARIGTSVPRPDCLRPRAIKSFVVRQPWPLPLCLLATAVAAAGCGSSGVSPADAGDDGAAFATCLESHQNKSVMPYAPGVTDMSSGGTYKAVLVDNQPGSPGDNRPPGPEVKGTNTWNVQIMDAQGTPVDGLTVGVSPYMPDHRHGTSVPAVTTPQGGGSYQITPLYLYMTGYWEVTLDLQQPADDAGAPAHDETVVFNLCIP
jgi:hypothetical protein